MPTGAQPRRIPRAQPPVGARPTHSRRSIPFASGGGWANAAHGFVGATNRAVSFVLFRASRREHLGLGSLLPHLHRDWTRQRPSRTRAGLTPATSALGLDSPTSLVYPGWAVVPSLFRCESIHRRFSLRLRSRSASASPLHSSRQRAVRRFLAGALGSVVIRSAGTCVARHGCAWLRGTHCMLHRLALHGASRRRARLRVGRADHAYREQHRLLALPVPAFLCDRRAQARASWLAGTRRCRRGLDPGFRVGMPG
jgi:hypothetical protein